MIDVEIKECFDKGMESTCNFLESRIFNFTPEEQNIVLPLLENHIIETGLYSLNPFLAYLYYCQNDNHMTYFYSKESQGIEFENIQILYKCLALAKMGYLYIVKNIINDDIFNNIIFDTRIPVGDRLLLAFILKKLIKLDNCSDEYTLNLYKLVLIQYDLHNNIRNETQKSDLEYLSSYFSDLFLKTSAKCLIAHFFDKEVYKSIPDEILHKFTTKELFDDYLEEKSDILKYCVYNPPTIENPFYKDFECEHFKILSYSNEIGYSFHALIVNKKIILVDCGAKLSNNETSFIDYEEFFREKNLDKNMVVALLITHAHFDHVGGYNELVKYLGYRPKVYLTKETYTLAELVNWITFENYEFVECKQKIKLNDEIKFEFIPNGHILGSTAIMVDCLGYKILFSGDYCLHNQNYVKGFDLNYIAKKYRNIDLLVTESTYGNKPFEIEYDDNIIILQKVLKVLNRLKYVVFMPAFAIGRSQELLTYIKNAHMRKISVLGMAFAICKYYQEVTGMQLLSAGISLTNDKTIQEIVNSSNVIIASSGMLVTDTNSYRCYNELLNSDLKVALLKTGYMDETSNGAFMLDKWEKNNKPLFEVSLSAHATYYELLTTINYLNPRNVLYVHGSGLKEMQKEAK